MPTDTATVRPVRPGDESALHQLVCQLADYEKLLHTVVSTPADFAAALFSDPPAAGALLAELDGEPVGMAIYFPTFSTFTGRGGFWLEDLFVRPGFRGRGIGRQLVAAFIDRARDAGCARAEWSVLDWNEPAIDFYQRLGATVLPDWRIVRIDPRTTATDGPAADDAETRGRRPA